MERAHAKIKNFAPRIDPSDYVVQKSGENVRLGQRPLLKETAFRLGAHRQWLAVATNTHTPEDQAFH